MSEEIRTISEKQLSANRANAQKSTGPRTEEGKRRSALNALRHGLTAQVTIMTEADREALEAFSKPIIAELRPVGPFETQLAQTIATFQFRINRIAAVEINLFALDSLEDRAGQFDIDDPQVHDAVCQAKAYLSDPAAFDRLSIYSQRLMSQSDKALKQLRRLQEERYERQDAELHTAAKLYAYFKMNNQPFDPRRFGFDFSIDHLRNAIRSGDLQHEVDIAYQCHFDAKEVAAWKGEKAA